MPNLNPYGLVAILLLTRLAFVIHQKRSRAASRTSNPQIYSEMRNNALRFKRESVGLPAPASPTEPWAVLMDWNSGSWIATVFTAADGTASIYLSNGGGFIGGQGVPEVNAAAKECVHRGLKAQSHMQRAETFPLPESGEVTLYVLTDSGVFTARGTAENFRRGVDPLSSLANAAQEVITQYRKHPSSRM